MISKDVVKENDRETMVYLLDMPGALQQSKRRPAFVLTMEDLDCALHSLRACPGAVEIVRPVPTPAKRAGF